MFKYVQIVTLLMGFQQIAALPNGAASCAAGNPLGGFHLSRDQTTGDLVDGGLLVFLNGVPLTTGAVATFPSVGTSAITVITNNVETLGFRGYLIRVDLGNGETMALSPDESGQVSPLCISSDVSGVTHTDRSLKSEIDVDFTVDEVLSAAVSLEVTVVFANNAQELSVWYSDTFTLEQEAAEFVPPITQLPPVTPVPPVPPVTPNPPAVDFPFSQFAFDGYVEPSYFAFFEGMMGSDLVRRCARRRDPPVDGAPCRDQPKVCFFGEQACPDSVDFGGITQPMIRSNCQEGFWTSQSFFCPTIDPVCPTQDPSTVTPEPVCSNALACDYGDTR